MDMEKLTETNVKTRKYKHQVDFPWYFYDEKGFKHLTPQAKEHLKNKLHKKGIQQTYRYSIAYIHKSDKGLYAFTFRAEVYLNEKKNKKDMAILLTAFLKESVRKTNLGLQRMFRDAYAQGIEAEEVSATEAERIGRYKFYFERIY